MVKTKSRPNCARTKTVVPTVEDQIDAALAESIAPPQVRPVSPLPSFSPYDLAKLACAYDRHCDEIQDRISDLLKNPPQEDRTTQAAVIAHADWSLHREKLEQQDTLYGDRCRAIEEMIPLYPAATLSDAAVQLSYALKELDLIHDEQDSKTNAEIAAKAERLILWAFEAVAGAAERPLNDVMDLWTFKRLAEAHGDLKHADKLSKAMRLSRSEQAAFYPPAHSNAPFSPVSAAFARYDAAARYSKARLAEWDGCGNADEEVSREQVWLGAYTRKEEMVEQLMALPALSGADLALKARAAKDLAHDESGAIHDAGIEGAACIRVLDDILSLFGEAAR